MPVDNLVAHPSPTGAHAGPGHLRGGVIGVLPARRRLGPIESAGCIRPRASARLALRPPSVGGCEASPPLPATKARRSAPTVPRASRAIIPETARELHYPDWGKGTRSSRPAWRLEPVAGPPACPPDAGVREQKTEPEPQAAAARAAFGRLNAGTCSIGGHGFLSLIVSLYPC